MHLNKYFLSNNVLKTIKYDLVQYENEIVLKFYETNEDFYTINKININGNSITKDSVIRSKLNIEPNDYFIETFVSNDLENLSLDQQYKVLKNQNFSLIERKPQCFHLIVV